MISPFSRGGHVVSEIFDHTSQLQFLHERFGVEVPNVSKWRRKTVGDLTSTLFRSPHQTKLPHLPEVALTPFNLGGSCGEVGEESELGGRVPMLPTKQRMPTQHGTTVPAGSALTCILSAANRDERQFPDPDRFDIHRRINQGVVFGHGIHLCLGAPLARLELRVALEEMLDRFPEWDVDLGEAKRSQSSTIRGWDNMPVVLT